MMLLIVKIKGLAGGPSCTIPFPLNPFKLWPRVAVSSRYDTCFAVKTRDGLYHFIFSIDRVGDTLWIPNDHMDLCQTHCVQVPDLSRLWGHVVNLDQSQASFHSFRSLPIKIGPFQLFFFSSYLLVYMGCALAVVFSGLLPLRSLANGPPIGVRLWGNLEGADLKKQQPKHNPNIDELRGNIAIITKYQKGNAS